ncbi:unnamed protein product [Phytomonas sp. EM1]|nr:unnamed protein product [Phytomonas sp. EM1]|eukprot:CCW62077.1 unnamed protein product [Phytomonas sp. isolate EM1]
MNSVPLRPGSSSFASGSTGDVNPPFRAARCPRHPFVLDNAFEVNHTPPRPLRSDAQEGKLPRWRGKPHFGMASSHPPPPPPTFIAPPTDAGRMPLAFSSSNASSPDPFMGLSSKGGRTPSRRMLPSYETALTQKQLPRRHSDPSNPENLPTPSAPPPPLPLPPASASSKVTIPIPRSGCPACGDADWNEVRSLLAHHMEQMKVPDTGTKTETETETETATKRERQTATEGEAEAESESKSKSEQDTTGPCDTNATAAVKPSLVLQRFLDIYATQEEVEAGVGETLRAQLRTPQGATGTLDVGACLDIIDQHDVSIIVTDTGTGKSSLLPKGILMRESRARIVNCQPRRTTTINLAERVAQLIGEGALGQTVGYSVRGARIGDLGETPLMYVTNFTLFLYLIWRPPEDIPFTHIILDEFHDRGSEVELLLVLLKLVIQRYPKKFKIVLCSATAQVEEWIDFFDNLSIGEYNQSNAMFPVHKYFIEDICEMMSRKCPRMKLNTGSVVDSVQLHFITSMIKETLVFLATVLDPRHSILVFLPGRTTVEHFAKWIHSSLSNELDPIMWYSGVDLNYIQEAIQRESTTKKKVYLATDIAELGLTLPDAVVAIDSGMCKRPMVSEKNPYSVVFPPLELLWESALNARQRCGRVGRVQQGFYFSMLHRNHFHHLGKGDSRIANSVLNSIVLLSLQLASSVSSVFRLCYQKPRRVSIIHSLDALQDDGFIIPQSHKLASKEVIRFIKHGDKNAIASSMAWKTLVAELNMEMTRKEQLTNRDDSRVSGLGRDSMETTRRLADGNHCEVSKSQEDALPEIADAHFQVTLKGFFVSCLHTSIHSASTAFYGVMFNIPMLCIIASVVESVGRPFSTPYDIYDKVEKLEACRNVSEFMRTFKGELNSDIVASVGAVLSYMDMQRNGFSDEAQEQWCSERYLSRIRLTETLDVVKHMKESVSTFFPLPVNDDIDALLEQYDRYALLLNFICIGAHLQRAAYVEAGEAGVGRGGGGGRGRATPKAPHSGSGIFIKMHIEKDYVVPSICPWDECNVCVPLILRTTYRKLRADFAMQVDPAVFNLATLIFAFRVIFRAPDPVKVGEGSQASTKHHFTAFRFQVIFMGVQQTFCCDTVTGKLIIQLRRMICARLRAMHNFLEEQGDTEDLNPEVKREVEDDSDFGIPDSYMESPDSISALLQQGLTKLLKRFEHVKGNTIKRRTDQTSGDANGDADKDAFCSVMSPPQVLPPPLIESLLVHSCNGIFYVDVQT